MPDPTDNPDNRVFWENILYGLTHVLVHKPPSLYNQNQSDHRSARDHNRCLKKYQI